MKQYRNTLGDIEGQAQTEYDRLIVTLSGGALGVTFAFVNQFIKSQPQRPYLLVSAWCCWVASLFCILASHHFSVLASRKTIRQVDAGTIHSDAPGGWSDRVLGCLNPLAGILFILGAILAMVFVSANM